MTGKYLAYFPALAAQPHTETSPCDRTYNCIAFAADVLNKWWWPSPTDYWPPGVPVEETIEAFIQAFQTLGYKECPDGSVEAGFEKVALYARSLGGKLVPTHAAKQLPNGQWKSKCGRLEDIEHHHLSGLDGSAYGSTQLYMRRPINPQMATTVAQDAAAATPESDAGEASPPTGVENPNAREDFTSLLNAAARKQKQDD